MLKNLVILEDKLLRQTKRDDAFIDMLLHRQRQMIFAEKLYFIGLQVRKLNIKCCKNN